VFDTLSEKLGGILDPADAARALRTDVVPCEKCVAPVEADFVRRGPKLHEKVASRRSAPRGQVGSPADEVKIVHEN